MWLSGIVCPGSTGSTVAMGSTVSIVSIDSTTGSLVALLLGAFLSLHTWVYFKACSDTNLLKSGHVTFSFRDVFLLVLLLVFL